MTRVQGCVSTVHLRTTVILQTQQKQRRHSSHSASNEGDDDDGDDGDRAAPVVEIDGTSDAMVSRGLLVLVSKVLQNQPPARILRLEPDRIADLWGLRAALSQGRNDGVASMVRTVQQHLREHQHQHRQQQEQRGQYPQQQQQQQQQQLGSDVAPMLYRAQPRLVKRASAEDAAASPSIAERTTSRTGAGRGRVALLLSGGVDSSVALHLLLQKGYDVTCYYLKIWLQDELQHLGTCPWEDDYAVCVEVCRQASVELRTVSLQDEYHKSVVGHSIREAELGRTPNPDILCNSMVKFGCFLQHLLAEAQEERNDEQPRGFDYVASGHYAQVERDPATGLAKLYRAPDPVKDQSYFLCALDQSQLQKLLFPIGHLQKHQVRELAIQLQLPNRARPDSQGLCFLGKLKFDGRPAKGHRQVPAPQGHVPGAVVCGTCISRAAVNLVRAVLPDSLLTRSFGFVSFSCAMCILRLPRIPSETSCTAPMRTTRTCTPTLGREWRSRTFTGWRTYRRLHFCRTPRPQTSAGSRPAFR
jgi:sulfur transfer protein SufE